MQADHPWRRPFIEVAPYRITYLCVKVFQRLGLRKYGFTQSPSRVPTFWRLLDHENDFTHGSIPFSMNSILPRSAEIRFGGPVRANFQRNELTVRPFNLLTAPGSESAIPIAAHYVGIGASAMPNQRRRMSAICSKHTP